MKPKLLIVDDEEINLYLLNARFSSAFEVFQAIGGREALEVLSKEPDMKYMITDFKMPNMNGVELATKADADYEKLVCFLLTGYEIIEDIEIALEAGIIKKVFKKPFDYELIKSDLDQY